MTRADWEAATPKCPGRPANIGGRTCARALEWTVAITPQAWPTIMDEDGIWCCPQHGPMLSGGDAAARSGWAPMRFARDAA
jgi:hypothetical protein